MSENTSFPEVVGTELSSAEEGRAVVNLQADEWHLNAMGAVHGGLISTLIDVSMAEALGTIAEEGEQPFTIQITVNYMKPAKQGTLTSTAEVRMGGERVTIVEAEVMQDDDGNEEVVALATGTYAPVG
ncbi:MAG TPA: PaaI family thioesterase [Rubrobacteraceae bacterium]|nr:PaaI family thioesterase [Rubrobacteraceae bacterium]